MLTKFEAEKAAERLLKLINRPGWSVKIWENMGWHYKAFYGYLSVFPSYGGGYLAMLSTKRGASHSPGFWNDKNSYDDPNEAIEEQIKVACEFVGRLSKIIYEVREDERMKVAFVAMAYNADTDWERRQNIEAAARVAAVLWSMGYVTICPHTNSGNFGGVADENMFYRGYRELIRRSDIVVAGPGWEESPGAVDEVKLAKVEGKILLEYRNSSLKPMELT